MSEVPTPSRLFFGQRNINKFLSPDVEAIIVLIMGGARRSDNGFMDGDQLLQELVLVNNVI